MKIGITSFTIVSNIQRYLKLLDIYTTEIKSLLAQIKDILDSDVMTEDFKNSVRLLSTLSGVGFITAITMPVR